MAALAWAFPVPDKGPTYGNCTLASLTNQQLRQDTSVPGWAQTANLLADRLLSVLFLLLHIVPNFLTLGT